MRRLSAPGPADERGAVVVISAVFVVVILIMAALVVDIGALHDERRQLQNGADAAALGVAQTCAVTGVCPLPGSRLATAGSLANGNALDSATTVDSVIVDEAKKTVTVKTSTKAANGGTILPYAFAQSFTGSSGATVHAKATATWSGLKRATVIPLTMSLCEFNAATSTNTVFDVPVRIVFHKDAGTCKSGPSGSDLPGGYGWVRDSNDSNPDDCNVTPSVGDLLPDDTGLPGTPHSCNLNTLLGKDILVPIYNSLTGTGTNGIYKIYGFGEFHLTGFFFSNSEKGTTGSAPFPCKKPETCLGGYFVKFVPIGETGGPSLGSRVALVN
jgi:Flp pilus assembly protein TadG